MGTFEVLVQAVTFRDQLLLPLSEPLFLDLDLLGEALPENLLLLLELGVVQLSRSSLPKLPSLHLRRSIGLVVLLLGGVDEIQHMRADEDRTKFLEVAVGFIFNLGHTPRVLTALYVSIFGDLDILFGPDDGERHGGRQAAGVSCSSFVVFLDRRLVDSDFLRLDDSSNLEQIWYQFTDAAEVAEADSTLFLNCARSRGLRVSALAMTGIRLTRVQSRFITSISSGFRV